MKAPRRAGYRAPLAVVLSFPNENRRFAQIPGFKIAGVSISMAASIPLPSTSTSKLSIYFRCLIILAALIWPLAAMGQSSASDNVVVRWNAAALQGVRDSRIGPPMVARALAVVHTCIFDAWAAYDKKAVGTHFGDELRRPTRERTLANKNEAISFAAYRSLADLFALDKASVFDPVPCQNSGSTELHPFNNVTGLLRKPLISKSIVILARDTCNIVTQTRFMASRSFGERHGEVTFYLYLPRSSKFIEQHCHPRLYGSLGLLNRQERGKGFFTCSAGQFVKRANPL